MDVVGAILRRAVVRAITGGALLALVTPSAPGGEPGCPPLDTESTWVGVLGRWQAQGLSPAQVEAFVRQGVVPRFPVTLWPPSGPAPLHVGVIWPLGRPQDAGRVELDADGDGRPEVSDSRDERLGHVYEAPGQYPATLGVRDTQGRLVTYAAPVTVLTPSAFDAELRGRWEALAAALEAGDLAAALECVHSGFRDRHAAALRSLLRAASRRTFPRLESLEFRVAQARYRGLSRTSTDSAPLDVRFEPDMDGIWRLTALFASVGAEP